MDRQQIYELIEDERKFQDRTYNPEGKLSSGQTRQVRDLDATPHLVLLDLYIHKAKEAWNVKGDNIPALRQVAKIAAIAVRALERAGGSEKLLDVGLRDAPPGFYDEALAVVAAERAKKGA